MELNFDELLERLTKKEAAKGGASPQITKIIENMQVLIGAAAKVDIKRLPFRPTVRQIGIALGVSDTKPPQFFYSLSERVREVLPESIKLEKEDKKYFIIIELPLSE